MPGAWWRACVRTGGRERREMRREEGEGCCREEGRGGGEPREERIRKRITKRRSNREQRREEEAENTKLSLRTREKTKN